MVENAPYNEPGPQELLIKNHAVAINPVDRKTHDHSIFNDTYPHIFGCDVAGVVEEIGSEVKAFAQGDRLGEKMTCLPDSIVCTDRMQERRMLVNRCQVCCVPAIRPLSCQCSVQAARPCFI